MHPGAGLHSIQLDMLQTFRLRGLTRRLSKSPVMAQADLRRVVKARRRLEAAIKERDDAIRAASASGETIRDIAQRAGLSFQRISQIVRNGKETSQS